MKEFPKFSIVTPSLNQCAYIEETIRSVISQEGDFEIEYLIMDGGSTDGSVEIIRRYAELVGDGAFGIRCRGVTLHWRSEKDSGQSDAINSGLRSATGEYAAYINSDDVYLPGAFAVVARSFRQYTDAAILYGDGDVIDQNGVLQWEWLSRPYNHRVMTTYHFLWNDFTNYIMQQSTFWRTSVHQRLGLFDETFHFAMDVEYWIRAGAEGLKLVHIPSKLAGFRMIQGTKSLSSPIVFWSESLEIFRRYRGARKLYRYLGYYLFNLAKYREWNLDAARTEAEAALRSWMSCSGRERRLIEKQYQRAYALACLLIANELQREGAYDRASVFVARGLRSAPGVIVRPGGVYPVLKQMVGASAGAFLDKVRDRFVKRYRAVRFDYRYHQRSS